MPLPRSNLKTAAGTEQIQNAFDLQRKFALQYTKELP